MDVRFYRDLHFEEELLEENFIVIQKEVKFKRKGLFWSKKKKSLP